MKQVPHVYRSEDLISGDADLAQMETLSGKWIPCRPTGFQGLFFFKRLAVAWKVFTGECDALKWEQQ